MRTLANLQVPNTFTKGWLTLEQLADVAAVSPSTLRRWCVYGIRRRGKTFRLSVHWHGGVRMSSRALLVEFLQAVNDHMGTGQHFKNMVSR